MSEKQNAEEDYITTPISVLSYITDLERQLEGIDLYIEAECHEAWAYNWEGREGAFIDMAKKLKQLKEQGDE